MLTTLMISLLTTSSATAGEGMWLPEQLPEVAPAWEGKGLRIPADKLGDPLGQPLGSIVTMGFCSASFVSEDGLMLTNHHCVEGFLQQNSSGEKNLHKDGFVAGSRADELSVGPGGKVAVVESITDVTAKVLAKVGRRTKDAKRERLIDEAEKRLVAECERERDRRCRVASYRGGAEFRLIKAFELSDVRIVAAPPMAMGQYGGEIDNWMWPRHGADFAVLRAYVAKDGTAADYSVDNVPYRPKHHLTVDWTGAEPDSFVMVAGYPGRTSRHARAESLRWYAEDYLPTRQALTREVHDLLLDHASRDPDAEARLGAAISSLANGLKNGEGLLDGLRKGGLIADKQRREAEILAWVDADPARKKRWRADLDAQLVLIEEGQRDATRELYASWIGRGADLLAVARRSVRWAEEREKKTDLERDSGYQDRDRERIEAGFSKLDRSLHLTSDRDVLALVLGHYGKLPDEQRIPELDAFIADLGGVDKTLDALYDKPALATSPARLALLDQDLATLKASDDPWVRMALAMEAWSKPRREEKRARTGAGLRLGPSWYAVLEAYAAEQDQILYDDANSTLRVSLGVVKGYSPEDGLWAVPQTTASGFAAKAGPPPFDAPAHMVAAARDGRSSRFFDEALGDVPVDFLTTLDTTGGNSGSAVLDGEGRLVGLLFDGNYESIAADWVYQAAVNRSICVDVRWVGFTLQQMDGAGWILDELGLPAK